MIKYLSTQRDKVQFHFVCFGKADLTLLARALSLLLLTLPSRLTAKKTAFSGAGEQCN